MIVGVDARFIRHSGIGRHVSGTLSAWIGDRGVIALPSGEPDWTGWDSQHTTAGMYSLAEQGPALRRLARSADVTWFPHYAHPWRCAGRWVCTVHDVIHLALPELFPGRIRRWAAHALLADVRDRAAAVCFVSRFTRDEFHRLVGAPHGSEHIVGNGVDPRWGQPAPKPTAWDGRPYVVAVSNVKPHKGLSHLLQAMLHPSLAELHLVLIGRADGMRTVDGAAMELIADLGERCHWTGPVGDDDLRSWVAHARLLAFPSRYEGFGLPPLEAMAAGVPVVASDIPAVCEVIAGTEPAATLVPPQDADALAEAIALVHCDHARRNAQILAGRQCAATWTWERTAAATWKAIEQVAT